MYLNTQTLQRTSESDIRAAFPNTSFPVPFVAPEGYALVFPSPPPELNPITQHVRELAPVLTVKGHYEQQWEVVALSPEQIAANQAAASAAMIAACDAALTTHLDVTAQQRRYDNRITCALRAGYPGPFQAEGQAFALWMDECNALAYQFLAEIHAGTRPMATDPQQLIDELPDMVWPIS